MKYFDPEDVLRFLKIPNIFLRVYQAGMGFVSAL